MKQRIISAFFGIILLIVVMLCNHHVFNFAVVCISTMAVFEVIGALGIRNHRMMTVVSLFLPAAVMGTSYFSREYIYPVVFLYLAVLLLVMLFGHKNNSFNEVSKFFAATVMITISFIHLSYVRCMENGLICVWLIFIGSWITDTFAYFTGLAFGKHKLAPSISPKKTIEGSVGGIIGVTAIITAYSVICSNIMKLDVNIYAVIAIGLLSGVFSQLGDLCASVIKRENGVKDFGKIMPGHGGVMDRFDSFLFVAPTVYYILEIFPVFM